MISLPRRSLALRRVVDRKANFQSAAGRIRRGEPGFSGMASSLSAGRTRPVASLPISQTGYTLDKSGSRLRLAAAGLWQAKRCLSYTYLFDP